MHSDMFYENKDEIQSTQHGFGSIMLEIGKSKMSFADRVMTMVSDGYCHCYVDSLRATCTAGDAALLSTLRSAPRLQMCPPRRSCPGL